MQYAFGDLLGDIGLWFLGGILLAGGITALLSPELISTYLGSGFRSMLVMLVVAVPLYICATSTTPVAAALALKGLSPGAALVFLLAGPATNAASLAVVTRILGRKATAIYLISILSCSLLIGMGVNWLYGFMGLSVTGWVDAPEVVSGGLVSLVSAILLLALIGIALIRSRWPHDPETCSCPACCNASSTG